MQKHYVVKLLRIRLSVKFKKRNYTILPFNYTKRIYKVLLIISLFGIFIYIIINYDIVTFISNQFQESNLIENEYVNPRNIKLTFPTNKRNIIYIYLESMESTYSEYTPNLTSLAEKYGTFSSTNKTGGYKEIIGANWTIASMVAQTSGLPLKFSVDSSSYNAKNNSFLNGITTLGEILKKMDIIITYI